MNNYYDECKRLEAEEEERFTEAIRKAQKDWFEVHYTDKETLYDYSTDIQAENAEEAQRIFESEHTAQFEVWAVWGK